VDPGRADGVVPLGATLFVLKPDLTTPWIPVSCCAVLALSWIGVLLTAAVVLGTGVLAANYRGGQSWAWAERLLNHIPLIRSLYGGTKKLAETLFPRTPALSARWSDEWPRKGLWSVGFQAASPCRSTGEDRGDMLTVFHPDHAQSTSGFIMQISRDEV